MSTFQKLLLLFIIIPVIEIYLLISVGGIIGIFPTIFLIILTAIIGSYLLRAQGLATLQKVQNCMMQGQAIAETLVEGILLIISGALLLTPGFFTDFIGFMFLLPNTRSYMAILLSKYIKLQPNAANDNSFNVYSEFKSKDKNNKTSIIEGEFKHEDNDN
jgi:UPF0716 protein FxsA